VITNPSTNNWPYDVLTNGGYNINFILSNSRPSYSTLTLSCPPTDDPPSGYYDVTNTTSTDIMAKYLVPSEISQWKLIEIPFSLMPGETYNWFSVNIDGQGEVSKAY